MKRLTLTPLRWLMPTAALLALACALLAPAAAVSPRRAQNGNVQVEVKQAEPAESVVRGHVVYDETSRPVRRARVLLITNLGDGSEYAALTDGRGDFRIAGVRAGTYYAFVDAPGVLSPVGFVSIEELRATVRTAALGEGSRYFDRIDLDGKQHVTVTPAVYEQEVRRLAPTARRVMLRAGEAGAVELDVPDN